MTREERGMLIAATQKGNVWIVPSQTSVSTKYVVSPDPESPYCSCLDHEATNAPCKHIFACRIVLSRESDRNGTVTETRTMTFTEKKTYRRTDETVFNRSQMVEKNRFQELLFDLCKGIKEPERNPIGGRIPNSLRD